MKKKEDCILEINQLLQSYDEAHIKNLVELLNMLSSKRITDMVNCTKREEIVKEVDRLYLKYRDNVLVLYDPFARKFSCSEWKLERFTENVIELRNCLLDPDCNEFHMHKFAPIDNLISELIQRFDCLEYDFDRDLLKWKKDF